MTAFLNNKGFKKGFAIIIMALLLIGVKAPSVLGQSYLSQTYNELDGLTTSQVYDVAQDSTGKMWFATRTGISSYDGKNWRSYYPNLQISVNSYHSIEVDEKGNIYALPATRNASFIKYHPEKDHFQIVEMLKLDDHNRSNNVEMFKVFSYQGNNVFVFGSRLSGFLFYYNDSWTVVNKEKGLSDDQVNNFDFINGEFLVATENGLDQVTMEGQVKNTIARQFGLKGKAITGVGVTKSKNPELAKIWITTKDWMGYLSNGKLRKITNELKVVFTDHDHRTLIEPAERGGVFFGNATGLFYYKFLTGSIEYLNTQSGLITEGATSLYTDREKNLWVTGLRGVTKFTSFRFANYSRENGLYGSEVTSIEHWHDSIYLLGHNGGISVFDGKDVIRKINIDDDRYTSIVNNRVMDMEVDLNGNVWIAASRLGLLKLTRDYQLEIIDNGDKLGLPVITALYDKKRNVLWVATEDQLWQQKNGDFKRVSRPKLKGVNYKKLFTDRNGDLFIATYKGLFKYENGNFKAYYANNGTNSNNIFAFYHDSRDNYWLGTFAGLYQLKGEKIQAARVGGKKLRRPVYLIFEDKEGVWFGTNHGMYRLVNNELKHYTVSLGLAGQEANRDAGIVDHYGRSWIGTSQGLSIYNKEFDYSKAIIPSPIVALEYVIAGPDTIEPANLKTLSHDKRNVAFKFKAISFIDEQKAKYQCKLEGFDSTWNTLDAGMDLYRYTNLTPGNYQFKVKASNALGKWSRPVTTNQFTVSKPFYFTMPFFIFIVLFLMGLILFTSRALSKFRYAKKMEQEVEKRTTELKASEQKLKEMNATKDKMLSVISHDLKNPFNSLMGFTNLLRNEYDDYSDEEKRKMIRILDNTLQNTYELLENLLAWASSQYGNLTLKKSDIDLGEIAEEVIRQHENLATDKKIKLHNQIGSGIKVYADSNMASTIIRNLVTNAIKFSPKDEEVKLYAAAEDGFVKVTIEDHGKGLAREEIPRLFSGDKDQKLKKEGTASERGTGLGLNISREFVEMNGGNIWVESEPGKGSRFIFTLPGSNNSLAMDEQSKNI
ncbi:MAG: hypothetical protein K9I94_15025 [Bacteroidales bacterium]|nr:hypothetical protein [Bacteroidales bacterium]